MKPDAGAPVEFAVPAPKENALCRLLIHRLSELEADRARILRHLSHELKTPLAALHEGVSLLREEVLGSAKFASGAATEEGGSAAASVAARGMFSASEITLPVPPGMIPSGMLDPTIAAAASMIDPSPP